MKPTMKKATPADFADKVKFASGATSGGSYPPFNLMTGFGRVRGAERFGYGNAKHEAGQTILADANWLKAFHARDLPFFRDRISHAQEHIFAESQGRFDKNSGGNWGAVAWCCDVMPFVEKFDPEFYLAVVGLTPHPGERKETCPCDRCKAKENVTL